MRLLLFPALFLALGARAAPVERATPLVQLRLSPRSLAQIQAVLLPLSGLAPAAAVERLAAQAAAAGPSAPAIKGAVWLLRHPEAAALREPGASTPSAAVAALTQAVAQDPRAAAQLEALVAASVGAAPQAFTSADQVFDGAPRPHDLETAMRQAVEENQPAAVRALAALGASADITSGGNSASLVQYARDSPRSEAGLELMLAGAGLFHKHLHAETDNQTMIDLAFFGEYKNGMVSRERFEQLFKAVEAAAEAAGEGLGTLVHGSSEGGISRESAGFARVLGMSDAIASAFDEKHASPQIWKTDAKYQVMHPDGHMRRYWLNPGAAEAWGADAISPAFTSMMVKALKELAAARELEAKRRARAAQELSAAAAALRKANPGLDFIPRAATDDGLPGWDQMARRLEPYRKSDIAGLKDTVGEFVTYGVLPEIVRRLKAAGLGAETPAMELVERLIPHAAGVLFSAERSAEKILGISERWHALRDAVLGGDGAENDPSKIRTMTRRGDWSRIADRFTVEDGPAAGYSIVNLVRSSELDEEGRELSHCVGGYSSSCIKGAIHIFSIRDKDGRRSSTFGLRLNERSAGTVRADDILLPDGRILAANETNLGKHNSAPTAESQAAFAAFKKAIENGSFHLMLWRTGSAEDGAAKAEDPLEIIGFKPTIDKNNQVFALFKEPRFRARVFPDGKRTYDEAGAERVEQANAASLVPAKYHKSSAQAFFVESGLAAAAVAALRELAPEAAQALALTLREN